MAKEINIKQGIDWTIVWIYILLVTIGVLNIYAAVYSPDKHINFLSKDFNPGKQLIFVGCSAILILVILYVDVKVFDSFAPILYIGWIGLLILTIFISTEIKGSRSWIKLGGGFNLQPAEFAKTFTVLMLAKYLSTPTVNISKMKYAIRAMGIAFLPAICIIAESETGQALTFGALLILLYREGLSGVFPALLIIAIVLSYITLSFEWYWVFMGLATLGVCTWYLFLKRYERTTQNMQRMIGVLCIAAMFVGSFKFAVDNVLKKHQANRIKVWQNPDVDPLGVGWNVTQSKLAIGSGGFMGKGYLLGTQTKGDFIPEQSTDFIFCTVGEEWGFVGTTFVILLYLVLFIRIINLAEKQKNKFARIYGYGVVSFLFFHFLANIGMTIGLMPIIGIPLPFISYGGSSLLSFTLLLFIFLKLDAHRSYKV
ncbi:MAG: rod shape-determining protein RodA [Leadbetterella sp.]